MNFRQFSGAPAVLTPLSPKPTVRRFSWPEPESCRLRWVILAEFKHLSPVTPRMQISVTGKQQDIGERFRNHARTRLTEAVAKYFVHAIEASVVLSRESHLFCSDISVHVGRGILVQGHSRGGSPNAAYDSAAERIAKQLRRYKRRLRDHHRKAHASDAEGRSLAQQYILAAPEDNAAIGEPADDQPVVIAEMATGIDSLTVGEAVMRMDWRIRKRSCSATPPMAA